MGGTRIKIGLVSGSSLESSRVLPTRAERGPDETLAEIVQHVREIAAGTAAINAVGIGVPGLVESGSLVGGLNLPGWADVPVQLILERGLSLRVRVMMDVEAIAAGEFFLGGHANRPRFFVFTIGTGVGAAAVLDGEVQAGAGGLMLFRSSGGEQIEGDFQTLEQAIAAPAIVARTVRALSRDAKSLLHELSDGVPVTTEILCEAAGRGDRVALDVWRRTGDLLGWAAVNVAHLLLLDRVVIGGGVSRAGKVLLSPTLDFFHQHLTPGLQGRCDLTVSTLGDSAGLFGAALVAVSDP